MVGRGREREEEGDVPIAVPRLALSLGHVTDGTANEVESRAAVAYIRVGAILLPPASMRATESSRMTL